MRQSILIIVACLLLGGFVLAGCGSDDDSSTAGGDGGTATAPGGESQGEGDASSLETSSASKDEYLAAAEQLCRQKRATIENKVATLFGKAGGTSQKELMSNFVDRAIAPGLESEADELRELGAPEGDEEQIEAIADAVEAMAAEARQEPEAFLTRPNEFEDANALAKEYGIPACGKVNR